MPEHEVPRLERLHRRQDRDASALALTVLRLAAAQVAGTGADAVEVHRRCPRCGSGRHGPLTLTAPGLVLPDVSVSHSGDLVVVALCSGARIGVDVEQVPGADPGDDVLASVLPPGRFAEVVRAPAAVRCEVLAEHWTRTEAVLKALRTGLALSPADLGPVEEPWWRPGARTAHLLSHVRGRGVGVVGTGAPPGFRAAVAVVGHDPEPVHHDARALLSRGPR